MSQFVNLLYTICNVVFYTHRPRRTMAKVLYYQCLNRVVLHSTLLNLLHGLLQYKHTPKQNEYEVIIRTKVSHLFQNRCPFTYTSSIVGLL